VSEVTLNEFRDKLDELWLKGVREFDDAVNNFVLDIARAEAEFWLNFNWTDLFTWDLTTVGTRIEGMLVTILDNVGNAFLDFTLRVSQIPIRVLSPELIDVFFPVPKWARQRVMTCGDAYKMVAAEMVETSLDLMVNWNWPGFIQQRVKQGLFWDRLKSFWDSGDAKFLGKLFKSAVKGKVVRLLTIVVSVVGGILVLGMIYLWAARVNDPLRQEKLKFRPLTNKNPFVIRKQKHRVRDNPKLTSR
jgi:hypothetical protein